MISYFINHCGIKCQSKLLSRRKIISQVQTFTYLGQIIKEDKQLETGIISRIAAVKGTFRDILIYLQPMPRGLCYYVCSQPSIQYTTNDLRYRPMIFLQAMKHNQSAVSLLVSAFQREKRQPF